jgi:fatty acid amide hydrolase
MTVTAPLADADVVGATASEMARRIAAGDWSSAEVVEAHLRRLAAVNPRLNALAVPLFDQARADARRADEARQRGDRLGPLHGVPVTVKEMFDVAGTPTTAGLDALAVRRAAVDAPVVARLRRAGAVVLGKTNVPQAGMLYETDNPIYGRTDNPWRPDRSPGGSSGGEAALIAARGSPLGLGSDGGGSIRHPCHCCGVAGLKPTAGRLPFLGHWLPPNYRVSWAQAGPMARDVADLGLALAALVEPDGRPPLRDPGEVSLGGLRVGVYDDDGQFTPAPALRRAVREAAAALRAAGAHVEDFRPPDVAEAERIYFGLFYADGLDGLRRMIGRGRCDWRVRRYLQLGAMPGLLRRLCGGLFGWLGRRCEATVFRWLSRRRLSPREQEGLVRDEAAYRARFLAALDARRLDALVSPPHGLPALKHGDLHAGFAGSYARLYNLLGLLAGVVPATVVRPGEESDRSPSRDPVLRSARAVEEGSAGLPVGVQVAARPWREDVALAVMAALERHSRARDDYPRSPPI